MHECTRVKLTRNIYMEILDDDTKPDFAKTKVELANEAEKPALTSEQFATMAAINSRVRDLKQGGFDMREYLDSVKLEVTRVEAELEKAREELVEKTKEMTTCFEEFVYKPFGISGQISISDTEPHYITVVETEQAG